MRPQKGIWVLLLCLVVALVVGPAYAAGFVYDDGKMFTQPTIDSINQRSDAMLQSFKKEVVVITVPSLGGAPWQQMVRQYMGSRPVNGFLIFIDKGGHKTYVQVGNNTQRVFGTDKQQALKDTINAQFKQNNFDAGIMAGISYIETSLQAAMPNRALVPVSAGSAENGRRGGGMGWIGLILVIVIIFVIISIIKAVMRAGQNVVGGGYPQGYSGPMQGGMPMQGGYPMQQQGGGGGGFWSSLLGGAGGAIVGNALYDKFARRDNEGYQGPVGGAGYEGPAPQQQPDWQSPDTSMNTSDTGSSWGDSSSSAGSGDTGSSWGGDSGSSWGGDSGSGGGDSGGGGGSDWS